MSVRQQRLWGSDYELLDMLDNMPGGRQVATRDFALVTLAGQLTAAFPGQLVFKGGFVLRHAHGHTRFSRDVDATRHEPSGHKLDAGEVADAIRDASINPAIKFDPGEPATDSARSLDFDRVTVTGELIPAGNVQVEVSYREGVLADPVEYEIGSPFYEPFEILTMNVAEMAAEKLRTLAQRTRETDLADLAVMLRDHDLDDDVVAGLAAEKFKLVKQGKANRLDRLIERIDELASSYDDVVPGLFVNAPSYRDAAEIVRARLKKLVPSG